MSFTSNFLIFIFVTIKMVVRKYCVLFGYEVKDFEKIFVELVIKSTVISSNI